MTGIGHHDLVLFDLDGTLIRSFMREGDPCERCKGSGTVVVRGHGAGACGQCGGSGKTRAKAEAYDLVEVLPGRMERVTRLREDGTHVAFVTNQGGVAFGYQTEQQVIRKMVNVCRLFGMESPPTIAGGPHRPPGPAQVYMSLGHPNAKLPEYRVDSSWRKPGGGMILHAMRDYEVVVPSLVLFVGDMETDRLAAEAAGVEYADAGEYFA